MFDSTLRTSFTFYDYKPTLPDIRKEVCESLRSDQKSISPKYFYDERGSQLFEAITRLPEYYLTRTEISILKERKSEIAQVTGDETCLIEYGSGNSQKVRILLESMNPAAYLPVDISTDHLLTSARKIHEEYEDLSVYPICADYTQVFDLPEEVNGLKRVAFFPGSSIGNFTRGEAQKFLSGVSQNIDDDGMLILGVDRRKDAGIIEPAYNDAFGITAAFNENVLHHLNHVIGANFVVDQFDHRAVYDVEKGCIEMHLISLVDQQVQIGEEEFSISEGESIHTENSHKYSIAELEDIAQQSGLQCDEIWCDENDWFMVAILRACS